MDQLEYLCAELISGDENRADAAAPQFASFSLAGLNALRRMMNNQSLGADVRWWAVRAMAEFEDIDETSADLLIALRDNSNEVRQAAALAFQHRPCLIALDELITSLSDPDPMVSRLASNALTALSQQATSKLLAVLQSENSSNQAKREAVRALTEIKDPASITGLMSALETNSVLLQYWAGRALDNLGVGMVYLKPE